MYNLHQLTSSGSEREEGDFSLKSFADSKEKGDATVDDVSRTQSALVPDEVTQQLDCMSHFDGAPNGRHHQAYSGKRTTSSFPSLAKGPALHPRPGLLPIPPLPRPMVDMEHTFQPASNTVGSFHKAVLKDQSQRFFPGSSPQGMTWGSEQPPPKQRCDSNGLSHFPSSPAASQSEIGLSMACFNMTPSSLCAHLSSKMAGALTSGAVPNFFSPIIPPPQTPAPPALTPSFMSTSYQPSFQQPIVPASMTVSTRGLNPPAGLEQQIHIQAGQVDFPQQATSIMRTFNGGSHSLEYNLSKTGTYLGVPGQTEGASVPTAATSSLSCLKDHQLKVVSLGQYVFADTAHAGEVLRGLNEQRLSKEFTDLRLSVRGRSFEAHRNVVASNNLYFKELIKRAMETSSTSNSARMTQNSSGTHGTDAPVDVEDDEARERTHAAQKGRSQSSVGQNEVLKVVVADMSPEAMEMLLDFIYTGLLSAKSCSAEALLEVTAKLKMEDFDQLCDSILGRELSAQSCLSIQIMAEALGCQELAGRARSFALQHFQDVAAAGELKHLGKIELLTYLSNDELNACSEEAVYEAAMAWLRQDPANRLQYAAEILGTVRLPFIHPSYLFNVVDDDHIVRSSEACRDLVNEAKRYHMLPHDRNSMHSTRTRPRHVAGFAEVIVLVGGRQTEGEGQRALDTVCCYNPQTSKWYPMAALPFCEREFFSIVSFGDNIYITGGMEGGNVQADIWCYMSSLDSWNPLSRMAMPRCRHSSLVLGTEIYALGGQAGPGNLSHVERFDIVSCRCEALAPLPKPVHSAAVVACNNKIFVFGGVNEAGRCASVIQSYTPLSNEWTFIETPMIDNKFVPAVILDSLIYILGGPFARAITIFDPKKENIKTGPNMTCNRLYSSAAVVGGKIYVVGGLSNLDGHALSSMDVYDPVESRWTLMHNLPCPVYLHGCTVIKKHLSIHDA